MEYVIVNGIFDGYMFYPQEEMICTAAIVLNEYIKLNLNDTEYKTLLVREDNIKEQIVCYQHWKMENYSVMNSSLYKNILQDNKRGV